MQTLTPYHNYAHQMQFLRASRNRVLNTAAISVLPDEEMGDIVSATNHNYKKLSGFANHIVKKLQEAWANREQDSVRALCKALNRVTILLAKFSCALETEFITDYEDDPKVKKPTDLSKRNDCSRYMRKLGEALDVILPELDKQRAALRAL